MASQAERDQDQKLRDELLIERYGLTPLVRPVGPHFPPPIDIYAWLETMQAAPQSGCFFATPGNTFNATADITIDPTP